MSERESPKTWDTHAVWGATLHALRCPGCDSRYLAAPDVSAKQCPHCCRAALVPLEVDAAHRPYHAPPELVIPATVDASTLERQIKTFAEGIPFAPDDLNPETLRGRLRRLWLPMWLVDAEIAAHWRAEVGFDYDVVSHQDRYSDGAGWQSRQVQETRVRWEPRVGRLQRSYDNIAVPAMDRHAAMEAKLGRYRHGDARAYTVEHVAGSFVRLPDRPPDAAWPEAVPGFQRAAAEECRQAAQAHHIEHFAWSPDYRGQHWTLLLLPIYVTHYLDDEGQPQPIHIHGQSGQVVGRRRASMQRAQRTALIIAIIAAVIFVLSLCLAVAGLALPIITILALVVGGFSLVGGAIGALYPIIVVSRFNRKST